MTEPINLRDAAEVWREAAYEYGGESIPGEGEDRAAWVIELDRAAVEAATIAKVVREIVAWFRETDRSYVADVIERKFFKSGEWDKTGVQP